jgi:hypothetical protein
MLTRTRLAYLAAGLTLLLGLLSLFNPLLSARLLGFELLDPRGLSEIRATYGALFVAMGAAMLWAAPGGRRTSAWLRLPGLLWVAAALGRILSMSLDGAISIGNILALAFELLVGLMALAASFGSDADTFDEGRPERSAARG